jgi:primosomal protein N' (replication factor Y)
VPPTEPAERAERPERVVRVVPDVPAIHRRFDYLVPPALDGVVTVGARVRIDLHGRRVGAWVVEDHVDPPPGVSPRPLAASSGAGPPPAVVSLAEWAAWRWAGPVSSLLGTASPPRVVPVRPADHPRTGTGSAATPPSPGGGAVALLDQALATADRPAVIRLAPALDPGLVVLEAVHRLGTDGVLVLAPSHARASQLAGRLSAAGVAVALLPDGWERSAAGGPVTVGTRATAFAPLERLRGAVVVDAHDEAYREERAPTWSAVDVVLERGRRDGAPVVLVSPCPPLSLTEGAALVLTPRSVERRGWPVVEVVDRTGDDPRTGLFSERLVQVVRSTLAGPGGRVVCVLNRTGRLRLLACATCGTLACCTRCGGAVAQQERNGPLQCRRCGQSRPPVCAVCDSTRLKALRIGVSRATEELGALAGVEAVELTGASSPGGPVDAPLVVGTEAALHRVGRSDLVAFLDVDQHLLAPRFGAGEETLALLARAARMVGTRQGGGRLLVQTRLPEHEVLRAAVLADPSLVATPERGLRQELGLPPFAAVAVLSGPGAAGYAAGLRAVDTVTVSAVADDRWLVRAADPSVMADALASVERPAERLRVAVDATDI